jgi:hypothetical protein
VAWYTILETRQGCVSAFSVDEYTSPPIGAGDMVFLTEGIMEPIDTTLVNRNRPDNCEILSSPTLARVTGFKYEIGTSTAQADGAPGHAEMHLSNNANC